MTSDHTYPELIDLEVMAHGEPLSASGEVSEADVGVVAEVDVLIGAVEMRRLLVEAVDEFDAVVSVDVEERVHVLDVRPDVVFSDLEEEWDG